MPFRWKRARPSQATLTALTKWTVLAVVITVPIAVAASSPLLAWRNPEYVIAGFSGVFALVLLLIQPLLILGHLPGLNGQRGRHIHRWVGSVLVFAVGLHVLGLWITSPPDVVDALLFRSPTPFSVWGVIALWAALASALLGIFRRKLRRRISLWRFAHSVLAIVIVIGSVVHALQIEGTMGMVSKAILCVLALAATVWVIIDQRSWAFLLRPRT